MKWLVHLFYLGSLEVFSITFVIWSTLEWRITSWIAAIAIAVMYGLSLGKAKGKEK